MVQTHEKIECTSTHEPMQTWLQVLDTLVHAGPSQLELIIEVQQITKLFHIKYKTLVLSIIVYTLKISCSC